MLTKLKPAQLNQLTLINQQSASLAGIVRSNRENFIDLGIEEAKESDILDGSVLYPPLDNDKKRAPRPFDEEHD